MPPTEDVQDSKNRKNETICNDFRKLGLKVYDGEIQVSVQVTRLEDGGKVFG